MQRKIIMCICSGEKQQILKTREEEEVKGFRFGYLKDKYPDHAENLVKFRDYLIEEKDAMKPLKAWEISDLGTCFYITGIVST